MATRNVQYFARQQAKTLNNHMISGKVKKELVVDRETGRHVLLPLLVWGSSDLCILTHQANSGTVDSVFEPVRQEWDRHSGPT
jgi:hypothetical protein